MPDQDRPEALAVVREIFPGRVVAFEPTAPSVADRASSEGDSGHVGLDDPDGALGHPDGLDDPDADDA